jgi:hypothetical protein
LKIALSNYNVVDLSTGTWVKITSGLSSAILKFSVRCHGRISIVSANIWNSGLAFRTAPISHLGPQLILLPVWEPPSWNLV